MLPSDRYGQMKIFFDQKSIPSQNFCSEQTWKLQSGNDGIWSVKTNLVLEIMTKMNKCPLELPVPSKSAMKDGTLCLSDLHTADQNLFGALFIYERKRPETKEEEVQIYEDLDYSADKFFVKFSDNVQIEKLSEKISHLLEIAKGGECRN
ncbi:hypothetical protein AKJ40_04010 [candidate division MSBL1 archaeon SCGC-AAA259M10]|uniref:Uncharacterized protein n=1 Tax=candidate division MSBL1 archaeon SCGC-AAA259M10 TaxID=1698270 RepID=A0A133UY10_9EURY|nr:hypothetical protein AKJ40_04010 [candidate division MSBL1 archaeon SCGC-AAA259M10]